METNILKSIHVPNETVKRILSDVKQIMKNPLSDNGIYYIHDETCLLKGYALIVGPEDTPYFGGYYFFEFYFPENYPYSPPKVVFHTNQYKIRFNPNLYTNGQVCVSILNTWEGEQWTACQTISTILLSLFTLLGPRPFLNEPGVTLKDIELINTYDELIYYANIDIAICNIINKVESLYAPFFEPFYPIVIEHFCRNKSKLISFCESKLREKGSKSFIINMSFYYRIQVRANYLSLLHKVEKCIAHINELNNPPLIEDVSLTTEKIESNPNPNPNEYLFK